MTTIAFRSGLVALVRGVKLYFEQQKVQAEASLGWAARPRQDNQERDVRANRVVFIPGDDAGKAGKIVLPLFAGDRPVKDEAGNVVGTVRALRDWERVVTVSVWACDADHIADEEAQAEACDEFINATIAATHASSIETIIDGARGWRAIGLANIEWSDVKTTLTPVDRSFGREHLLTMTYRHPLFAEFKELVFPGTARVNRADA